MGAGAVLGVLGVLGLIGAASGGARRRSRRPVVRDTPTNACALTPESAARESERVRFDWLGCDGRTPEEAARMVARLRRSDAAAASRAEQRWNAVRAVASEPPDGNFVTPAAVQESQAVEAGQPVAPAHERETTGTLDGVNVEEARRLVGPVIRALRERSHYRSLLRDFQRAAGITADGEYGPQSYNALVHFGGVPPQPFRRGDTSAPEAQYPAQARGAGRMTSALARAKAEAERRARA